MKEVHFRRFQHYPRLYPIRISNGSRMSALLCQVLPVQALILYIALVYRPSSLISFDHRKAMQNRLICNPSLASWFYFNCYPKRNSTVNPRDPFHHLDKNYFLPVPPISLFHYKNDLRTNLSQYRRIMSDLRKGATRLA